MGVSCALGNNYNTDQKRSSYLEGPIAIMSCIFKACLLARYKLKFMKSVCIQMTLEESY